jgi:hypothetical protein
MKMFLYGAILLISPVMILAEPCAPGTLQTYVSLGSTGCELGDWRFADFILGPVPPFPTIDPMLVNVTPGGTTILPELFFAPNLTANAGEQFGLLFHFVVTGALSGVSLQFNSPATSGDGSVLAFLDVCPDDFFDFAPFGCSTTPDTLSAGNLKLYDSMTLPAASFYHTSLHLYLEGGSGSASLDSASIGFSPVPEPDVTFLTLAGLGAICLRRRLAYRAVLVTVWRHRRNYRSGHRVRDDLSQGPRRQLYVH